MADFVKIMHMYSKPQTYLYLYLCTQQFLKFDLLVYESHQVVWNRVNMSFIKDHASGKLRAGTTIFAHQEEIAPKMRDV